MGDVLTFLVYIVTPALVGLGLTVLIVRASVDIYRHGAMAVEDVKARRLEVERARLDLSIVTASEHGVLLHRDDLRSVVGEQFGVLLARLDAQRLPVNVPHSIHYAPHNARIADTAPVPGLELVGSTPLVVPSFRELFEDGIIYPGRFLLGYNEQTQQPHYGVLKDVYSSLIIAKSGGGKTTLMRFLLAQACNMGADYAIIDPHGRTGEGLAQALNPLTGHQLFTPAIDDEPIADAMRYFLRLIENRVNQVDTTTDPRILAVDELNMLIDDLGSDFANDLTRIAERGRKVGVFVFAAGQSAEASRTGGDASLRKAFVGRFILRADKDAVGRMVPDRKLLDMVPHLQPGHTIFVPTRSDPVPLAIPDTTEADLLACFGAQVVEPVPSPGAGSVPLPVPQLTHEPTDWVDTGSRTELVRQMFLGGQPPAQIIREVWGVQNKGRAWVQASQEFNEVLRSIVKA